MKKTRNILLAVAETLDAVPLRCDQVESAAKISACSQKLKELAEEMTEEERVEHEGEDEHGA